jgi:hypothetical protein
MKYVDKFLLIFFTFINLRFIQVNYRIYYKIRNKLIARIKIFSKNYETNNYNYIDNFIVNEDSFDLEGFKFYFLNKTIAFETIDAVDFGTMEYGELWCYHLNYFDYANQENNNPNIIINLISIYVKNNYDSLHITNDPYPISMRIVNMIKFISDNRHSLSHDHASLINNLINKDINTLEANIEYHLMGNHILENYLTLIMSSLYFSNNELFNKYERFFIEELDEQFLDDGFHFELSIMYHNILVEKLLNLYSLTEATLINGFIDCKYLNLKLKLLLIKLLRVSHEFRHDDNTLPLFNDTVYSYSRTNKILDYADRLGFKISINRSVVSDYKNSGYFKVKEGVYTLFIDAGKIGPKYIPGHGHCDLLSFELSVDGKKTFTNIGVSTYEYGDRRILERSTVSHNTVNNGIEEQSEIWSRFRVARQAKILKRQVAKNEIIGKYQNFNKKYTIERRIRFEKNKFFIEDISNKNIDEINFYCMPDVKVKITDNLVEVGEYLVMEFRGKVGISLVEYYFAQSYNILKKSTCINIKCNTTMNTIFFSIKEVIKR